MDKERILNKKVNTLNELKSKLVSRSEESKEFIVQRIKDTVDDIELILKDFEYIKEDENDEVDVEMFVKRGGYRCDKQFTVDELEKFNDTDNELLYISVDRTVYDVSESRFWQDKVAGKDASERIFSTLSIENPESLDEGKVVGTLID